MIERNYLEFLAVDHCNLRCKNCITHSQYAPAKFYSVEEFEKDITALSKVLSLNIFRFIGGEFLLHPNVDDFLEITRKVGIAKKLSIFTNGALLPRQSDKFYELIDEIKISKYHNTNIDYENIDKVLKERCKPDTVVDKTLFYYFTKTFSTTRKTHEEVEKNFDECELHSSSNISGSHTFRNGYYLKCIKPTVQERFNTDLGLEVYNDFIREDGCAIHKPNLEARLRAYLDKWVPLATCYYCNGHPNPLRDIERIEQLPKKKPDNFYK